MDSSSITLTEPFYFSGEAIGIEYLYKQTGKSLDGRLAAAEKIGEEEEEEVNEAAEGRESPTTDEGFEDEEVEDLKVNVVNSFLPTQQGSSSLTTGIFTSKFNKLIPLNSLCVGINISF